MVKKKPTKPVGLGKVMYRYIPRRVYGVTNPKHVLYDGKLDSAIDKFQVLRHSSGKWIVDLTEKEKDWITDELNLDPGALNTNDRYNTYLEDILIEMPKHGLALDTNDPYHLLIDRILLAYNNVVAPNSISKKHKASYRYVRLKENEETKVYLAESDKKKAIYKALGSLEESRERMILYILNNKVRINPKLSTEELRKMVNVSAEKEPELFLSTLNDPLFTEKGMLNMAVIVNVVDIKSGFYYYDDIPLAFKGKVANLTNAALYIADSENSDIKLAISEKVLNEFNGTK